MHTSEQLLFWILGFTALGGLLSALAASVFMLLPRPVRGRVVPHLVSFATGALLGAALLALLPHAILDAGMDQLHRIGLAVLGGILFFFVLEKLVLWRHCHHDECEAHGPSDHHRDASAARMILIGDGLHNFLDGVLIGAAFLTDVHLGVVTALAVIAHEIPQEVGDIAIMLNGGMSRRRALLANVAVSMTTVLGGLLAWFALEQSSPFLPYVLAVAASSFLYIAVADLIPGLHRSVAARDSVWQVCLIAAGVGIIALGHSTLH